MGEGTEARTFGLAWRFGSAALGWLGFRLLGYPAIVASAVLAVVWVGGRLDLRLPLPSRRTRYEINVGGALIPLAVAVERAARLPASAWKPLGAAVAVVAALSLALARPVAGRGVVLAWPLTGLLAGALGLISTSDPGQSASFAFAAGTIGPLLGAEILLLPAVALNGARRASIGGDGPSDGLVWSGLLAALAAGPY